MVAVQQIMLLLIGAALLVFILHMLAWRLTGLLGDFLASLPMRGAPRVWARLRPVRAWLRLRHPRLDAALRARLSPQPFTGLPLTLLVLSALYVAALLGGLVEEVIEGQEALRLDRAINAYFAPWRTGPLIAVFLWITALGSGPALAAVTVTATGFLWTHRRAALIVPLWVAFLGAEATTWAGKFAIARHRPEFIAAAAATSPSFPSGHATGTMAVYGFLAYVIARDLSKRRQRFEVVFWTGMLVAMIGFSRIFLSVHYATDVAAGFLVGAFWLLAGFAIAAWIRRRRLGPKPPAG